MKKILLILMGIVSVGLCGCSANSENEEQRTAEVSSGITAGTGQNGETQNETTQGENQSTVEEGSMTAGAKNNMAEVPEERIIQEQSFLVELDGWGSVEFVSCEPDYNVNYDDASFFLAKDGQILYQFPYYCEENNTSNYVGLFDSVEAVGFRDVNLDGKKDVIIIINYITGAGPQGMVPRPTARIFLAGEKEFCLAEDMMSEVSEHMQSEVSEHMQESELTVDAVYRFVADTASGQGASAAGNTPGSSTKTLQDGSLPDAYKEILDSVYEVLLGKEIDDAAGGESIGVGVREARIGRTEEEILASVGYTLYDVDGNGMQELIIADTGEGLWDNRILNMYTLQENEPVTVLEGWARNRYYILNDGRFYYEGSGGAAYTTFATYRMGADGCSIEPIDYYFTDYADDAAGVTSWFHNTTGEDDVKKSENMELENDEDPWKMQEEFEAQVMPLDLTFFGDYH